MPETVDGAPLGQQEAASFDAVIYGDFHTPGFRRRGGDCVEWLELHFAPLQRQLAASPATVAGMPSQEPTDSSEPSASTNQP
jgi:hypothetical protein